ncbi:MAG TPA: membrane protein insertase YidC [Candidatus Polarisedimenticolia bacterium]|nr:membrane protein insertase YidC [Candidatus Polarisedimenticolia bacterium]
MTDKRLLLAVALSIAFLFLWTWFFTPLPAQRPPAIAGPSPSPEAGAAATRTPGATAAGGPSGPGTIPAASAGAPGAPSLAALGGVEAGAEQPGVPSGKIVGAPAEETVTVDTPLVEIRLTNRGARVVSWKLKKYLDDKGTPLDLISPAGHKLDHLPLQLLFDDEPATKRLMQALFVVSRRELDEAGARVTEIGFSYSDGTGLRATKTLRLSHVSYVAELEVAAAVRGGAVAPTLVWGAGFGPHNGIEEGRFSDTASAVADLGGEVLRIPRAKVKADEPLVESGPVTWAGLEDRYFAAILAPQTEGSGPAPAAPGAAAPVAPEGKVRIETLRLVEEGREHFFLSFALAVPGVSRYHLFVGPKDYDLLLSLRLGLERLVNFGVFSWFAMPLFYALKFIDRYIGNFGWAIVILTALIRVLFFPLMHRSQVKMRQMQEKMKRVQPKLKALRERYHRMERKEAEKGNARGRHQIRQKMNEEMMQLYKEEGINPLGSMSGCLPMLLQLPFLWAFYQILLVAIELRRAPFVGYLRDLSQKDPHYITPVIMGVTMLVQQRMTASSIPDPAQRRMMYLMPIMFTYFFLNLPSGLVLYWLTSNLLGIGQQYLINRQVEAESRAA